MSNNNKIFPASYTKGYVTPKSLTNGTYLVIIFCLFILIGLANLYSASAGTHLFVAQLKHLVISLIAFVVFGWAIPIRSINHYAYPIFWFVCLLLVLVLFLGHTAGGSQRWIILGPLRLQPSEIAKITTAIMVSKWFFNNRQASAYTLTDLWPVLFNATLVFSLIFLQPDLGTAGICLLVAISQIAFVKINRKSLGIVVSAGVITAVVGWNFLLHSYQKLRILNLLNPNLDPQGSGYNSLQSLVAIGSGGGVGKGFLKGTQTQLRFLPARHTDFIFSVFAEEHGFIGAILVFILFGLFSFKVLEIAKKSRDTFCGLLAIGLLALIFIEFAINISMVLGLFPVVGMPLPFFSYGGSSLLTVSIVMGFLIAIDRDNKNRGKAS